MVVHGKRNFPADARRTAPLPPFLFVRLTIPLFLQGRLFTGIMETEAMVFECLQNGGV
jgi:hypothetical protein